MKYISTRGQAPLADFQTVLLDGLARDGGLFVPEQWPELDDGTFLSWSGMPYAQVAAEVMRPFVADVIEPDALGRLVSEAYERFEHQSVAPLVQIGPNEWVMELFHGPTLAFKDVAMQVLARLYDHVLAQQDEAITILGATSGDTGSAAIEAARGRERVRIFIMHPHGRTSEVQRRQMTTVDDPNVHNIAIEGTFDDCQNILKALFNDHEFRDQVRLSGVNSINWARIMPQIVYYITAAMSLGAIARKHAGCPGIAFSVPTGNFGDIFAGYVAVRMGLPVTQLLIATNVNDILTRTLLEGDHSLGDVTSTMSPSMDIQVSSNFERLLFDLFHRNPAEVLEKMQELKDHGRFELNQDVLDRARLYFGAQRVDEDETLATIRQVHEQTGYLLDPHTAVGVAAARRQRHEGVMHPGTNWVTLGTAHPAKFPDAVEKATGIRPPLPPFLADLYEREEKFQVLPADAEAVKKHIRSA